MLRSRSMLSAAATTEMDDSVVVQNLALQAYHLPGNSWWEDWRQYILNNHPIFGICFHHQLHPIKSRTRLVALVGTIVVGLAMTNLFYLFYLWNPRFNQPVFTLPLPDDNEWTLTTGMLLLWTVGGSFHTVYNLAQWYIAACACCRTGGCCASKACCPSLGKHFLRVFVLIIVAITCLIILLRVAIASENDEAFISAASAPPGNETLNSLDGEDDGKIHFFDDDEWHLHVDNAEEFQFLAGYLVEMVLALFVYYPIGGTLLFSGILGRGRVPLLGGRPYEVAVEERRQRKLELQQSRTGISTAGSTIDLEAIPVEHVRDEDVPAVPVEHVTEDNDVELIWSTQTEREFQGRRAGRSSRSRRR